MTPHDALATLFSLAVLVLLRWAQASFSAQGAASVDAARAAATADHTRNLSETAALVVADTEANVVRPLKDPTTPGVWDDAAKKVAKQAAVALLRHLAAATLRALVPSGDPQAVDVLAGAAVERAVAAVSAATPSGG